MIRSIALLTVLLAQTTPIAPQQDPLIQNRAPVPARPAPNPNAAPSKDVDRLFAKTATESSRAEIAFAKLALARSHADEVKSYARKMISEHMGMTRAFAPLVVRVLGMQPPKQLSPSDALTYYRLQHLASTDFDQTYILTQVTGHLATQGAFQAESEDGADAVLVVAARAWLPTIKSHLELAVDVTKHVGGDNPFKTGAQ